MRVVLLVLKETAHSHIDKIQSRAYREGQQAMGMCMCVVCGWLLGSVSYRLVISMIEVQGIWYVISLSLSLYVSMCGVLCVASLSFSPSLPVSLCVYGGGGGWGGNELSRTNFCRTLDPQSLLGKCTCP